MQNTLKKWFKQVYMVIYCKQVVNKLGLSTTQLRNWGFDWLICWAFGQNYKSSVRSDAAKPKLLFLAASSYISHKFCWSVFLQQVL